MITELSKMFFIKKNNHFYCLQLIFLSSRIEIRCRQRWHRKKQRNEETKKQWKLMTAMHGNRSVVKEHSSAPVPSLPVSSASSSIVLKRKSPQESASKLNQQTAETSTLMPYGDLRSDAASSTGSLNHQRRIAAVLRHSNARLGSRSQRAKNQVLSLACVVF